MRLTITLLFILALFGSSSSKIIEKRSKHVRKSRWLQSSSNSSSSNSNSTAVGAAAANGTTGGANATRQAPRAGKGTCRPELTKAFGLSGQATPIKVNLEMCPSVVNSCCTVADQNVIFENWVTGKEEENLKKKVANYTTTLSTFFNTAADVTKAANNLLTKLGNITVNNECSLMARRILTYQIEDSSVLLNQMFAKTYQFLSTSHKGFYCALCDAKSGTHFDIEKKKTVLSERYCRDLLTTSLPTSIYLHSHLPRYLSILALFMSNCDNKGVFKKNALPTEVAVPLDANLEVSLKQCFDVRNDANWSTNCAPVCENFQIGRIAKMFEPNLKQLRFTTEFLKVKLTDLEQAIQADAALKASVSVGDASGQNSTNATAAPAAKKSRILREKYATKRRAYGIKKYDRAERRLPRRLQQSNGTADAANATAASANGTAGGNGTGQWQKAKVGSADGSGNGTANGTSTNIDPMEPLIYNSFKPESEMKIDVWTSAVRIDGLHFFEFGLFSEIAKEKLKSLRALLKVRKLKARSKVSRKLNSAGIMHWGVALALMWLIRN